MARKGEVAKIDDSNIFSCLADLALNPEKEYPLDCAQDESVGAQYARKYRKVLKLLLDSPFEPCIVTDPEGTVLYINGYYSAYLGFKVHEVIGRKSTEIIENSRLPVICKNLQPEIGILMRIKGLDMIVTRLPVLDGSAPVGVYSHGMFFDTIKNSLIEDPSVVRAIVTSRDKAGDKANRAKYTINDIVSYSPKVLALKKSLPDVAKGDSTVLIIGETGVGKEIFAHSIHQLSERKDQPFVRINCAAIPEQLLESELFGYEDGAFTGARKGGKPGKFEQAGRGTIFLDEIGDMPIGMQVKLLRILQEREVERIGGNSPIPMLARVIAATNQSLDSLMKGGKMRKDLFFRLNRITVHVPPLRERPEDIQPLFHHFLAVYASQQRKSIKKLSSTGAEYLLHYDWPGNVRELEAVAENLLHSVNETTIEVEHLKTFLPVERRDSGSIRKSIAQLEDELLKSALQSCDYNRNEAAKILGMSRSSLFRKLKKSGLAK